MVAFFRLEREEENMRPRKPFPLEAVENLNVLQKEAKSIAEFRRIQCVWLRAALNLPVEVIAQATGLSKATVRCYHSRYLSQGEAALRGPGKGGDRHRNLSVSEEDRLLQSFLKDAKRGGILEVGRIKAAYEEAVGRVVPKSTVYRMLARHGWRKLAPRPKHPKTDFAVQAEWKKNSPESSRKK
jgi:transposase